MISSYIYRFTKHSSPHKLQDIIFLIGIIDYDERNTLKHF